MCLGIHWRLEPVQEYTRKTPKTWNTRNRCFSQDPSSYIFLQGMSLDTSVVSLIRSKRPRSDPLPSYGSVKYCLLDIYPVYAGPPPSADVEGLVRRCDTIKLNITVFDSYVSHLENRKLVKVFLVNDSSTNVLWRPRRNKVTTPTAFRLHAPVDATSRLDSRCDIRLCGHHGQCS